MPRNQKGISLPILLVIVVVVILITYLGNRKPILTNPSDPDPSLPSFPPTHSSPTPSPTPIVDSLNPNMPGYKLFTNEDGNFQISYPEKWSRYSVFNYYDPHDDLNVMEPVEQKDDYASFYGKIQLSVGHIKKTDENSAYIFTKFDEHVASSIGNIETDKTNGKLMKQENIRISNNPGVKFTYENNYEGVVFGLIHHVKVGDTIYFINFFSDEKQALNDQEVDKILNSFKLLTN